MGQSEHEHLVDLIFRVRVRRLAAETRLRLLEETPQNGPAWEVAGRRREAAKQMRLIDCQLRALYARLEVLCPGHAV